jgi:hypothetical protein
MWVSGSVFHRIHWQLKTGRRRSHEEIAPAEQLMAMKNGEACMRNTTRVMVLLGSALGLLATGTPASAQKSATSKDARRAFYLTRTRPSGGEAPTACAAGYHMASMWEILDPSNLRYDTALGRGRVDSGSGPPVGEYGFVRTGGYNIGGNIYSDDLVSNCQGWTSNDYTDHGVIVGLSWSWTDASNSIRLGPWRPLLNGCHNPNDAGVWCVQD